MRRSKFAITENDNGNVFKLEAKEILKKQCHLEKVIVEHVQLLKDGLEKLSFE